MDALPYQGTETVSIGDGSSLPISNYGSSSANHSFLLKNLLHIPAISKNLLSVRQFCQDNMVFFEFHPSHFCIKQQGTGRTLITGRVEEGLYVLPGETRHPQALAAATSTTNLLLWHQRFGHPSAATAKRILQTLSLPAPSPYPTQIQCDSCERAKAHSLPHPPTSSQSSRPFDLLFIDLWGPAHYLSTRGNRYYVSILDDCSKFLWLFPIIVKSQASHVISTFLTFVTNYFSTSNKAIQADNEPEFMPLKSFFTKLGILHRLTCPYSHPQNGSIENRHRHIVERGLALLAHSHMPLTY